MKRSILLISLVFAAAGCAAQLHVTVNSETMCIGSSATLNATVTGGTQPYHYLWSTGDTIASIMISPSQTDTIQCIVTDSGLLSDTAYAVVTVENFLPSQPSPITGPVEACYNQSGLLYSVTAVPGVTYTWTWPYTWTYTSGQGTNELVIRSGSQNGIITVTPGNACGNGASQSLTVSLLPTPGPTNPITGNPTPCQGSTQTYCVDSVPYASNYNWGIPASWTFVSGVGTNCITVIVGSISGMLVVTPANQCGNGSTRTLNTSVQPLPAQPSVISGPLNMCEGSTLVYSITYVSGIIFTWTVPAGWNIISGQGSDTLTVTAGTSGGTISVYGTNACGSGPARNISVNVMPDPAQPGPIIGPPNPAPGMTANFCVTDTPPVYYNWEVPTDWTITAGQGTNCITVTIGSLSGDITVIPTLNGCPGPAQILYILLTGLIENAAGEHFFEIIPNPAKNKITLVLPNNSSGCVEVSIFNTTGELVYSIPQKWCNDDFTGTIDVSSLANGIHVLQLKMAGRILSKKLIIMK